MRCGASRSVQAWAGIVREAEERKGTLTGTGEVDQAARFRASSVIDVQAFAQDATRAAA